MLCCFEIALNCVTNHSALSKSCMPQDCVSCNAQIFLNCIGRHKKPKTFGKFFLYSFYLLSSFLNKIPNWFLKGLIHTAGVRVEPHSWENLVTHQAKTIWLDLSLYKGVSEQTPFIQTLRRVRGVLRQLKWRREECHLFLAVFFLKKRKLISISHVNKQ